MVSKGIIVKINKSLYTLLSNEESFVCQQTGRVLNNKIKPTVGDYVIFDKDKLRILEILPRKNSLIRPLISNIDKLFIVTSTHIPIFSTYLIDKLLLIALSNNIEPIIVLTKRDLISYKEKNKIKKYKKYYKKLEIKVYDNTQINKIVKEFDNSVVALAGQTGAGKSTLLNKLSKNLNLQTDEISQSLKRGKHTTRITQLYKLFNGLVADTPGFSSIELNILKSEVKKFYKEFNVDCKYKNCTHIKEDECNVKNNLNKNKIYDERYNNYIKIVSEVEKC